MPATRGLTRSATNDRPTTKEIDTRTLETSSQPIMYAFLRPELAKQQPNCRKLFLNDSSRKIERTARVDQALKKPHLLLDQTQEGGLAT
jgi:hypothetical protein